MTTKQELLDLAARVEAGGADRALDHMIAVQIEFNETIGSPLFKAMSYEDWAKQIAGAQDGWVPHFTASLDAAMQLVPEGWAVERASWHGIGEPVAFFDLWQYRCGEGGWGHGSGDGRAEGQAPTPAAALTAAALRARAEELS